MKREIELDSIIENKYRNVKVETKIISYAIRKNHLIFSKVFPEYFTVKFYKDIAKKIGKHNEKTFERNSFSHWIKKNFDEVERVDEEEYLDKIFLEKISSITSEKTEAMITMLSEHYELRNIMLSVSDVIEMTQEDNFDPKKIKDKLRSSLYYERPSDQNYSGDYLEDFDERKQDLEKRINEPEKFGGLKFGIKALDDVCGGMFSGEVAYFIAPSGHGKTIALQNVACNNFLQGKNVGFVSLEMPKKEVGYRLDSRLTRFNFSKFRKAEFSEKELATYEKRIKMYKEKLNNSFEIMCFHRGVTPRELEESVLRWQDKTKQKMDLLICDYINLMSSNNSKNKTYDTKDWKAQGEVSWDLKCCAGNLDLPIVSAGQVTDEFDQKKPSLFSIKYSRAISENANMVFALGQTTDDILEGVIKLHFLKLRGGKKVEAVKLINNFDLMTLDTEMYQIERVLLFGDRHKKGME